MTDAHPVLASLARISGLTADELRFEPVERERWATGDYVAAEVVGDSRAFRIELPSGRLAPLYEGDLLVSALGVRRATLEVVGDWRRVPADGRMHVLSGGGILGWCTSSSPTVPRLPTLAYRGHVFVDGRPSRMGDWVETVPARPYAVPTVLVVGTSMSAGKTTVARTIVRLLRRAGLRVLGAKLTGAGRYHDILTMADAGAAVILDFVDAGLPSTACPEAVYRRALDGLLPRMDASGCDVAVIEAGASPLEPYNGRAAIEALGESVRMTVLAASDPYAVLGVMQAFERVPDLVGGRAADTEAGVALIERLTGLAALDVLDPAALPPLAALLEAKLGVSVGAPVRGDAAR